MNEQNQGQPPPNAQGGIPPGDWQNRPEPGHPASGGPNQYTTQQPQEQWRPPYPTVQQPPPQQTGGYPSGTYHQPPQQWYGQTPPPPPPTKNRKPLIIGLAVGAGAVILALLVIIGILLAGRNGGGPVSQAAPGSGESGRAESRLPSSQSLPPISRSPGISAALDIGTGLTFRSTKPAQYEEFTSALFLYPNGFYLFRQDKEIATLDEYGEYAIEGDVLTITPIRVQNIGRTAGPLPAKQFTIVDQDTLVFNGELGSALDGDEVFEQTEHVVPPLDDPRNLGAYVDEAGNELDLWLMLFERGAFSLALFNNPNESATGRQMYVNGSYRQEGDTLVCTIEAIGSGFTGDDLTELTFRFTAPGVLEYTGEPIGDIQTGDVFRLWDHM